MRQWLGRHRVAAALGACALVAAVCLGFGAADAASAAAEASASSASPAIADGYRLKKATISDCTASSEENSTIDTSRALLEGLSFVQGNPFYLNVRTTLTAELQVPLPCDSWVEKCEWTYNDVGQVKAATMYKSTKELSRVQLSYDSLGSVSKVVGWTYVEEGSGSAVRHDFEASNVVEKLSSSAYGVNKTTVVNAASLNDTVLYTYDKDRNLTSVASSGAHPWSVQATYNTTFKYPTRVVLDAGDGSEAVALVPTYDGSSKLVSLRTGTWDGEEVTLSGIEYELQYSKGRVSKVNLYEDDAQVMYCNFSYDDVGNLASIRAYKKGGVQLYNISFTYELA